jgi:hypothetical protein
VESSANLLHRVMSRLALSDRFAHGRTTDRRFWSKADMAPMSRAYRSGAFDPNPKSRALKARSAALSCHTKVCYPFGSKHGRYLQ